MEKLKNRIITDNDVLQSISLLVVSLIPLRSIISVKIHNVIIVIATILMFLIIAIKNKKIKLTRYVLQFTLFVFYCITSVFYSNYLSGTAWALMRLIPTFITGFLALEIGISTTDSKEERIKYFHKIVYSYTITTVIISLYMLIYELPLTGGWGRLGRITFAEEGQMFYSYHLIICITYLVYLLLLKNKSMNKVINSLMLGILIVAGISTSIRKVLIAPLIFLIIGYILKAKFKPSKIIKYSIFIIIVATSIYYIITKNEYLYVIIGRRVDSLLNSLLYDNNMSGVYTDYSIIERNLLRVNALNLFKQYPIFGYGLDAFKSYTYMNGTNMVYAHSNYLELLASTGVIGLGLYYLSFISLTKRLLSLYFKTYGNHLIYPIAFLITQLILDYGQVIYFVISYISIFFLTSLYLEEEV